MPSPHISEQVSAVVVLPPLHDHPDSIAQVELHPSPLILLPSSQYVPVFRVYTLPSPQISVQVSEVEVVPPDQV